MIRKIANSVFVNSGWDRQFRTDWLSNGAVRAYRMGDNKAHVLGLNYEWAGDWFYYFRLSQELGRPSQATRQLRKQLQEKLEKKRED